MPPAAELVTGYVTGTSAFPTAVTYASGDSGTVKNFPDTSHAYILNVWAKQATPNTVRIRGVEMHDDSQALRLAVPSADAYALLPWGTKQAMYPQQKFTFEFGDATASEVGVASILMYYEDVLASAGSLATWEAIEPLIVNYAALENALTSGATAGDYGGSESINTDSAAQILRNNQYYAILGYLVDSAMAVVYLNGPATGNRNFGGPAPVDAMRTRGYFKDISQATGLPLIPVINAADQDNTNVGVVDTATGTSVNVDLIVAQLSAAPAMG